MNISFSSSKRKYKDLRDQLWKLEEKFEDLEEKLDSLCDLLGVAFKGDRYDKKAVYFVKDPKKGE